MSSKLGVFTSSPNEVNKKAIKLALYEITWFNADSDSEPCLRCAIKFYDQVNKKKAINPMLMAFHGSKIYFSSATTKPHAGSMMLVPLV